MNKNPSGGGCSLEGFGRLAGWLAAPLPQCNAAGLPERTQMPQKLQLLSSLPPAVPPDASLH